MSVARQQAYLEELDRLAALSDNNTSVSASSHRFPFTVPFDCSSTYLDWFSILDCSMPRSSKGRLQTYSQGSMQQCSKTWEEVHSPTQRTVETMKGKNPSKEAVLPFKVAQHLLEHHSIEARL